MPLRRWHHRWNVLAFSMTAQALTLGVQSYSFAFWVVRWSDEFGAPRSELMLIITVSVFVIGLMSPFAGIALDKFPVRILFCIGVAVFSISLFMVSTAHSHWMVMFYYGGLLSLGFILAGPLACQKLITQWFVTNRGLALGINAVGISIGAVAAPPIVTALLADFGWRETFKLLAAVIFVILLPIGWLVLRNDPASANAAPEAPSHQSIPRQAPWSTRLLLRNRDFWIIALGFFALLAAYLPVLYSTGAYARDLGITQQRAAVGASIAAIVLALGKITFGKLADLTSHRLLYWGATGGIIVSIAVVSVAQSFPSLLLGLALTSFFIGSYYPLTSSMIVARFGAPSFGQVMGLVSIFVQCGALAPFVAGLIRDASGSYTVAFLTMLVPLVPAMIAMRWLSAK
jgi:MFS family permease